MHQVQKILAKPLPNRHGRNMTFADRLRRIRTKLCITVPEAAQLLGFGERTVFYWESGQRVPKPATQEGVMARLKKLQETP